MPKLNVQQNNQNVIQAFRNALAIGRLKGIIASDGNHNFSTSGSNDNLLDNAYFVGGGSQLGDGIFPINQRGQTSYIGAAATGIDRWWQQYDTTATLTSAGVRITGSWDFAQILHSVLPEETYTFSVDVAAMGNTGAVMLFVDANNQLIQSFPIDHTGINTATITSDQIKKVGVNLNRPNRDGDLTVRAMKLEKGSISTLANDAPPDFGEELRKCQRYLWCKAFPNGTQIGTGVATDANTCMMDIVLPVPMRTGATVTFTANMLLVGAGGFSVASAITSLNILDNHARMYASSSSLSTHNVYSFATSADTVMTISAEPQ